ncbi:MAG: hypothetical protein LBI15_03295 [Dysgonamonadaceae bacterium]|nr:hypothetical protein [Dysgonamonadaceae bacterium]
MMRSLSVVEALRTLRLRSVHRLTAHYLVMPGHCFDSVDFQFYRANLYGILGITLSSH